MIENLKIERFKCFIDENFELKRLTIFTGMNGSGKSTAIQPLLLLAQTLEKNRFTSNLLLNDKCVNLGKYDETINFFLDKEEGFSFCLSSQINDNMGSIRWSILRSHENDLIGRISDISVNGVFEGEELKETFSVDDSKGLEVEFFIDELFPMYFQSEHRGKYNKFCWLLKQVIGLDRIKYISAERMGPRNYYPGTYFGQHPHVGQMGEYAAQYIDTFREKKVDPKFTGGSRIDRNLRYSVSCWLSHIITGTGMAYQKFDEGNIFKVAFRSSPDLDYFRPSNSSNGLSYALPIVASCLGANKNDNLIIENPEAFLHPISQARMGEFLATAAAAGANVIIETQSDYILQGVSNAVYSRVVEPKDVSIVFFGVDEKGLPIVVKPRILSSGKVENWPEDLSTFFEKDESDTRSLK